MRVDMPSHASWVYDRDSPAAPADPTGWKPVQLVPETRRAGARRPAGGGRAQRESGDLDRGLRRTASAVPASIAGRSRSSPTARHARCRSSSTCSTSPCPTRTACTRCCTTRAISPSDTTAAISTPRTTASRIGTAWNWCTPTTRQTLLGSWDRFSGAALHGGPRLRGPGQRSRQRAGAPHLLRTWARSSTTGRPHGRERRVDDAARAEAAARDHVPLHARRARTAAVSADPARWPTTSTPIPAPGRALPIFVTSALRRRARCAPSTSGTRGRRASVSIASPANARAAASYWFYNGGRPAGGAITIDAPATDARATIWAAFKHDVRGVLLLARRALAAQLAESRRARPERLGRQHHVRQPQAAGQADRRPGLHPRRRRAALSWRGASPSRAGPRHRRARSPPCSSRTSAAVSRITST